MHGGVGRSGKAGLVVVVAVFVEVTNRFACVIGPLTTKIFSLRCGMSAVRTRSDPCGVTISRTLRD